MQNRENNPNERMYDLKFEKLFRNSAKEKK